MKRTTLITKEVWNEWRNRFPEDVRRSIPQYESLSPEERIVMVAIWALAGKPPAPPQKDGE